MQKTLIDILIALGKVSENDAKLLRQNLTTSKMTEEDFLLTKFSEDIIFNAKSKFYGVPLKEIAEDYRITSWALSQIPEETAKTYKFIPLKKEGSLLELGMVHPQDMMASDAVKFILTSKNLNANIFLITNTQFDSLFKQYSAIGVKVQEAISEIQEDVVPEIKINSDDGSKILAEAPINKIVNVIFKHAYEGGASDIHIEPIDDNTRIRFRVDGVLHASLYLPKETHSAIVSKIKILSNLKIDESRIPQDGRFRQIMYDHPVDFRVSTFPTTSGEKVVIRILDSYSGLKKIEDLGFVGYSYDKIMEALKRPFGMVLTTGPTGSGKSTTLQSMLGILNKEEVNVVSLEDPVEYYISGVNQSQVRPEIQYTFASGLRSILRQDPNVIMVGEIRDKETANLATHAALTGHIVLSTIHTNDALGVIPRLIDMGVESFLLPPALNLVIAQRLVKKLCVSCKTTYKPEGRAREILNEVILGMPKFLQDELNKNEVNICQAKGCPKCSGKGTKGRIVIFEVIEMTKELRDIIINGQFNAKIEEETKRQNMITMKQDGIIKVLKGIISLEDVVQATV
ncbi:MAG: GspE/PulE family protein [Patescibacteria group bacterium]